MGQLVCLKVIANSDFDSMEHARTVLYGSNPYPSHPLAKPGFLGQGQLRQCFGYRAKEEAIEELLQGLCIRPTDDDESFNRPGDRCDHFIPKNPE